MSHLYAILRGFYVLPRLPQVALYMLLQTSHQPLRVRQGGGVGCVGYQLIYIPGLMQYYMYQVPVTLDNQGIFCKCLIKYYTPLKYSGLLKLAVIAAWLYPLYLNSHYNVLLMKYLELHVSMQNSLWTIRYNIHVIIVYTQ